MRVNSVLNFTTLIGLGASFCTTETALQDCAALTRRQSLHNAYRELAYGVNAVAHGHLGNSVQRNFYNRLPGDHSELTRGNEAVARATRH